MMTEEQSDDIYEDLDSNSNSKYENLTTPTPGRKISTKITAAQMSHLIKFMEKHPDCASGRTFALDERIKHERLWNNLTDRLNALGGPVKNKNRWKQTWRDMRNKLKKKMMLNKTDNNSQVQGGMGNESTQSDYTAQGETVMTIMGGPAMFGLDDGCTVPLVPNTNIDPLSTELNSSDMHITNLKPDSEQSGMGDGQAGSGPVNYPQLARMRARRRVVKPVDTSFEGQVLALEKQKLDLERRKVALEERRLQLQEKTLQVKEAKVRAIERIAVALERGNNKQ